MENVKNSNNNIKVELILPEPFNIEFTVSFRRDTIP
jgi:hypothetical protein